ncbi:HAD family hydrolase [Indiicoccus explosivorum]|uniref:HAD family hydrolase n=1 Tax=Indiicoccus explosivorum TaxID=1917864 RepID=UPI0030C6E2B4
MKKAVLFDLDGTLLDRDASLLQFVENQRERLLPGIPPADFIRRFIELDAHGYVWKDEVYARLVKEFSISHITSEQLLADYINKFSDFCVPFRGLTDMLRL